MSEATARAAVVATLSAVTDIGLVHNRRRWAPDWSRFIANFKTTIGGQEQIRGWQVSRRSASEDYGPEKPHVYRIEGFMGYSDASSSEITFNALVEAVAAAFRADITLGGAVLKHDYIQAGTIEERYFGSVLCHYCELSLTVHDHNP